MSPVAPMNDEMTTDCHPVVSLEQWTLCVSRGFVLRCSERQHGNEPERRILLCAVVVVAEVGTILSFSFFSSFFLFPPSVVFPLTRVLLPFHYCPIINCLALIMMALLFLVVMVMVVVEEKK